MASWRGTQGGTPGADARDMTNRLSGILPLALSLLSLGSIAGCDGGGSTPDAPIDAGGLDATMMDAPRADASTSDAPAPTDAATSDGGTDAVAPACTGAASCDDGLFCTDDACVAGTCTHTPRACPEDDNPCTTGAACDETRDACVPSLAPATVICRPSAGVCDLPELCTGSSPTCPADAFQNDAVTCRASTGDCDKSENCTGTSASCPTDLPAEDGTDCETRCGMEMCMGGVCMGGMTCSAGRVCLCDTACGLPGSDCP